MIRDKFAETIEYRTEVGDDFEMVEHCGLTLFVGSEPGDPPVRFGWNVVEFYGRDLSAGGIPYERTHADGIELDQTAARWRAVQVARRYGVIDDLNYHEEMLLEDEMEREQA